MYLMKKKFKLVLLLAAAAAGAAFGQKKGARIGMKELNVKNGENTVYGKIIAPKDEGKHPVIIFSHGYNGCHQDFLEDARFFAKNGYVAMTYDFCGGSTRSQSTGRSSDMTLMTEKSDLISLVEYAGTLERADPERIFILGGSQGGMVSALVAEELGGKIKAMALYYPAFCIPDDWRKKYPDGTKIPQSLNFWGLELGKPFIENAISIDVGKETGGYDGGVLIVHGDLDDVVPMKYSKEAAERYKSAELKVLPGERHGFTPAGADKARKLALEFFEKQQKQ